MTLLKELEEEFEEAVRFQDQGFIFSGAYAAHQEYMGYLMDQIAKEKGKTNDNLSKNR